MTMPLPSTSQRGRTLIELLVSIALGLLILLGVGGLYLASNQSTRSATNVASAENVAQVALMLIGQSIRRSAYAEIIGTEDLGFANNLLYAGPTLRACRGARFTGDDPNAGCGVSAAGAPDSIALWFQAENALAASQGPTDDCVGTVPDLQPVTNANFVGRVPEIRVVQNNFHVVGNDLRCRGGANTQPLLSGVEDLKVYFGFDDIAYANPGNPDVIPTARSVRDADFLNGLPAPTADTTAWDYVVSVSVCVLVRTDEAGVTTTGSTAGTPLCPADAAQAAGTATLATLLATDARATDGRIRRAMTQTFSIRSRTKASPLEGRTS